MRQGQQNRRGRGRHNNGGHGSYNNNNNSNSGNRKGQNPLARSYESNGPDVKIRGNPAHIAEKYMTLARDAQSSGDSVLAEAYLQHAEHYNRIIMAFREQQQQSGEGQYRQRPQGEATEGGLDGGDDESYESSAGDNPIRGQEPQPGIFDAQPPRFVERQGEQQAREDRGNRDDRGPRGYDDRQPRRHEGNRDRDGNRDSGRRDRQGEPQRGYGGGRDDRPERRERFDRYQNQDRSQGERSYQERPQPERIPVERAAPEPQRVPIEPASTVPAEAEAAPVIVREPREAPAPRRRSAAPAADRFADAQQEQPEFLRRPVRRPRRETPAAAVDGNAPTGGDDEPSTKE